MKGRGVWGGRLGDHCKLKSGEITKAGMGALVMGNWGGGPKHTKGGGDRNKGRRRLLGGGTGGRWTTRNS